jgi:hypothetical protein
MIFLAIEVRKGKVMVVGVLRGGCYGGGRESLGLGMGSGGREFSVWAGGRKGGLVLWRQGQR